MKRNLFLAVFATFGSIFVIGLNVFTLVQQHVHAQPLFSRSFVSFGQLVGQWTPHDPQHREPPEGWFCTDEKGHGDHTCDCQHECVANQPTVSCEEDGTNCTTTPAEPGKHVVENAKCSVYCHPKHCACKVKGCSST